MPSRATPLKQFRFTVLIATALAAVAFAKEAPKSVYLQPSDVDWASVLPGPPADDSPEHKAEIASLLQWQERRTKTQEARCRSEEEVTVYAFSDVLGDWFTERTTPFTAELMNQAYVDAKAISATAKQKWNRPRPPLSVPEIHPCVKLENTGSYPSGHATRGVMWATFLSEIFPDRKDALMARGMQIGQDRLIAGMHFQSDVNDGQKLGAEIARKMMVTNDFSSALQRAKMECQAAMPH